GHPGRPARHRGGAPAQGAGVEDEGRVPGGRPGGVVGRVRGDHGAPPGRSPRQRGAGSGGMTPRVSPARRRGRARRGLAAVGLAGALAAGGCDCGGEKRELGLSRARDGAPPVVVVDRVVQGGVSGPVAPEVEPNDERDKAAAVAVPGGIDGALAGDKDVDFYRIEPGAARTITVKLTGPPADDGGADLVLKLHDADGEVIATSDRGPAGTVEGLAHAALADGAGYFLSVSPFVKKSKKKKEAEPGEPASYRLAIETLQPGPGEEAEPNDEPAGA